MDCEIDIGTNGAYASIALTLETARLLFFLSDAYVSWESREGEESRAYLIELYEAYVAAQHNDGYQPSSAASDIPRIRASLDADHSRYGYTS